MSKEKKVPVAFKKPWRGYNKGEIAGFDEAAAETLVNAGLADYHNQAQAKSARGKAATAAGSDDKAAVTKTDLPAAADKGGSPGGDASAADDARP